jgi:hypothetical protein
MLSFARDVAESFIGCYAGLEHCRLYLCTLEPRQGIRADSHITPSRANKLTQGKDAACGVIPKTRPLLGPSRPKVHGRPSKGAAIEISQACLRKR